MKIKNVLTGAMLLMMSSDLYAASINFKLPFSGDEKWSTTNAYGDGYHVNSEFYALDFSKADAQGANIVTTESGEVITVRLSESYGNYVEIDHSDGYKSLYAHMEDESITVKVGEQVL